MKKVMSNFLKGLTIGAAAIAPGVSGGALAVILGIYEKITYAIGNIFKNFKKNLIYLAPYGFGALCGVLIFSNIFKYLFKHYNVEVRYLFIGLMLGTFPSLFKRANKKGFRKSYIALFILTFSITFLFAFMENRLINIIPDGQPSILELIICGLVVGFGTIIPGVSSSVILIYLGYYEIVLEALASLNIPMLIPIGLGFIICFLLLSKLISMLFERVYGLTYYGILGFVLGSIVPIFPGFQFSLRYIVGLIIMIISIGSSYYLCKFERE
ncbi:MAG: DUF368 domain-containing protein [Tissierellia bacterium]|nr:DUF368 domain-containing protein [Tissierellia bacterium]